MPTIRDLLLQAVQLQQAGRLDQAEMIYRQVLAQYPDHADALHLLGSVHLARRDFPQAEALVRRAIAVQPNHPNFHNTLGLILAGQERHDQASHAYREALRLRPQMQSAIFNLAHAMINQGEVDEAIALYRRSLELAPDDPDCHSNLLYAMHFDGRSSAADIDSEARRWDARHAAPLRQLIVPHRNDRNPDRAIRVGFVSPDLWNHAVGRFLLPLLEHLDRRQIQSLCYYDNLIHDSLTDRLRGAASDWRSLCGMSNDDASALIRDDRIDVLFDLSAHSGLHRLLLFALKPAPIQITYLGYPGTTGLATMDYRVTDPCLEPPGGIPSVERPLVLPETYWCYAGSDAAPPVSEPPALSNGWITFGCMNKNYKVRDAALDAWAEILAATPGSRLILHAHEGVYRQRVSRRLHERGIDASRISFVGVQPLGQFLATFQQFDIALDSFPYNGGTVTCDALYMGVPVVSLAGAMPVHRAGLSLLSAVGLPQLVAQNQPDYVRIAIDLAAALPRLSQLRRGLREQMRGSPLMNAPRFATNVCSALRSVWREWCGRAAGATA
jgi:predicted O-linked N-acetylglucosamine transferase (SPINDLY family)